MSSDIENNRCAVCYLKISDIPNATLHEFPDDARTRTLWLNACGFINTNQILPNSKICSKHFENECFEADSFQNSTKNLFQLVLKPNAVPTKCNTVSMQSNFPDNNDPSLSESTTFSCPSDASDIQETDVQKILPGKIITLKDVFESSDIPIVFNDMLDDWEPFKWDLEEWKTRLLLHPLHCRKGQITCTKEPLWERKCSFQISSFSELNETSETIQTHGNWIYFDYKHIGQKIDSSIFDSISWRKLGYENDEINVRSSTLWIGSAGAHTPCHQDLYGINIVAQVYGKKRWILMPPEMSKYLQPTRIPYEESSNYSKINFSCPENIKKIDKNCKYVSVILSPGDILCVPHKWWHYVENLTTAVSINAWVQVPKYDHLARIKESVVRFMVASVCNVTPNVLRPQLLNPNEEFTPCMALESSKLMDYLIKKAEKEKETAADETINLDSTCIPKLFPKVSFQALKADKYLYTEEFDTMHHRIHHSSRVSNPPTTNTDISFRLLDAFCSENVINEVVKNLMQKD